MLNKRAVRETLYIFLAFSGAAMVFLNTVNYGPGITDDSLNYIYSGTHLNLLKGFFNFDGSAFINWPPLYSFIIFLLSCVSSDIFLLLTIYNTVLCFLTVLLIGKTAEHVFTLPAVKIMYTATLTFSYQVLFIYSRVWSETVFLTLIILITLLIIRNPKNSRSKYILILSSLCMLTRYLGISMLISYFIYEVLWKTKSNDRKNINLTKVILYSLLTILPSLIWLIRNKIAADNFTSLHFNSMESLFGNFWALLNFSSSLFIPESVSITIRITLFVILLAVIAYLFIKHKDFIESNKFLLLFCIVYICFLLFLSGIFKFDSLSYRFLIPIYFVLLILVIYPVEHLMINSGKKYAKVLSWIALSAIFIFPVEKGFKHTFINFYNGVEGYHSKTWIESETIKYIKTNLYNQNVYSNSASGIYANTGLVTKKFSDTTKYNPNESGVVQIIFNKNLPEIEIVPDLSGTLSAKDSIIYFYDSYIILRKN
jgi:hypothetical protein